MGESHTWPGTVAATAVARPGGGRSGGRRSGPAADEGIGHEAEATGITLAFRPFGVTP
ncbi:hypothetical protein [Nonomuraea cavernae]|uniref:hypothetical protein n=1 Tax=Nonomuraea cavernae TaxID=2045107 RepID=UPI0033EC3357